MFEIESGLPLPPRHNPHTKYPFAQMKPGDSFFVPVGPDGTLTKLASKVANVTARARKEKLGKFAVRKLSDGVRVWRVE